MHEHRLDILQPSTGSLVLWDASKKAALMAWHRAAAKATIHYGPRVFLTIGSILMGARIRVRPLPDAPAMTGHTLAVCASAVFLGRTAAAGRLGAICCGGARGPAGLHGLAAGRAQTYHRLRRGGFSACAWLVGRRRNKPLAVFVRCCAGQFATLLIGSVWLIFPGYAETLPAAWALGVRPYLGGALVKSTLVRGRRRAWVADAVADVARGEVGPRSPHAAHVLAHRALGAGAACDRRIDETTVRGRRAWEPGGGTKKRQAKSCGIS